MSEPLVQRVTLSHDEVISAAMASQARRQLSVGWYFAGVVLALFAASWLSGPLAFMLVQQLPISWMFAIGVYLPTILMALLGLAGIGLVSWAYSRAARRKLLREFTRLGIPLEREGVYEILTEGLRLTTDRIEIFPRWEAIDTIERVESGWALSAEQLTFLIPTASFADEREQRAFVGQILARMSETARARSSAAVQFAG